jgi:predicted dehydrogenase
MMSMNDQNCFAEMDRRRFLKTAGLGAAALALGRLPFAAAAQPARPVFRNLIPPDRKMNIACVGAGGKGTSDILGVSGENIVALCDVSFAAGAKSFARFPDAARYKDYRQMLLELGDKIDAVVVSTPDHMHFPIAMMAVTMGKHVYVQKPLTHSIGEARALLAAARTHGVVTQMGNQGHANEGTRLAREWVQAGVLGQVREVHIWTDRPIWPQAIDRPATVDPIPENVEWNLWLGVARERPYHRCYAPFKWRGWWDFGTGALGDMGCHLMDAPFWALDLKHPTSVEAVSAGGNEETAPRWSVVTYQFPACGHLRPVTVKWYDGKKRPPRPKALEANRQLRANGQLYIGDKATMWVDATYGESPRLIPEARMQSLKRPPKTIPRVPKSDPHLEWISACKGGPVPGSNFEYSGPLTEMVLLGNLAIRLGRKIEWDAARLECRNLPEAQRLIHPQYRLY